MHIPDGFLTGQAAALGTATAVAGLAVCLRGARGSMREKDLPLAGLAAAFFLVAEAPMAAASPVRNPSGMCTGPGRRRGRRRT